MAGTISEGKNADTDLVIYNDYPSLELDLRKPGINTGTTIYFNEGDSGYLQTFILIEDRQYEPAGYNASVSSLIATNIATGKTTTYSVDSSVNSGTNIGAFSVPNEITETAGAYECYLTFKSDKGNYSSPRWIYQVVSASNGTAIDLPEATAEQLESKLNGKISELRDNVVSLSNKIDHSVAIDTSDFIHAEQFNAYKTDTDTKIQAIKTTDEKQSNDIVTNKNNIAQNTSDISSLKSDMSSVKSDISTAQDNIKALQDKQPTDVSPDLTQIKSDIKSVQDDTKQNSKDIATLSADDSALQEKVADIQNTQSNHTSDITQLQSDLKSVQNTANSNKTDIATTKQDIATINEKLATIGTGSSSSGDAKVPQQVIDDVAQNKQDIAKNKTDIATNKQTIATNTTDITNIKRSLSADESQISTNTTNISQNEQDIANLKKSSKELSDKVANLPAPDDAALLKLHTIVDTNTHNIADNAQNITTINQKLAKMPTATDLANVTSTATDAKNTATEAKQQANDNATNIATLTDKVSKIKQPDLSDYAKKSDLPADKSTQVSKNTTDIANLTNKVNGIHLPDLSPYLKSSDAATTYLTTATASETYAKLTDIPADKSTDIAKNKQDIANINDKIKTLVVPDLSSYLTKTEADSTYAKKSDIPDTSNFITTTDADKKYATVQQAHKESQDAMKYTAIMGAKLEGELAPVSQTASQASSQATTNAGDIYELQNDVSNIRTSISNIPTGGFKLIHTLDPNSDFYGMVDSAGNLKKDCFWITDSGCAFMGQKGNSYFDKITENSFIPVKQTDTDITNTYLVSTDGSLSKATHNLDYYKFAISGVPIDHSNGSTWNFNYDTSSDTLTITINATYIASNIWSFLWNSNWMYNGTQYLLSTIYLSSGYVKLIIPAQFQSLPEEIFLSDTSSATTITINHFLATTGNSGKTMGGGSVLFNSGVDATAVNGANAMGYDD